MSDMIREANKIPPFKLEEKRAIVKSRDHRGREQLGFGEARDVWINFALAPLASGLVDSVDIRFVGGAYWYRVRLNRAEALQLIESEVGTEELLGVIKSRYSLEAVRTPRSRLRCSYFGVGRRCDKEALDGWTTCKAHEDKGAPRQVEEIKIEDILPENLVPEPIPEPEPLVVEEEEEVETEDSLYQELQAQRDHLQRRVWELERRLALALKDEDNA